MKRKFVFTDEEITEILEKVILRRDGYVFRNGISGRWFTEVDTRTGELLAFYVEITDLEE